jgi:hypothetical protein
MIAGWVIALMGIALLIYGGAIVVALTVAKKTLAVAVETEAFKRAQASAVVKAGDSGVEWLVAKIPFGFVRDMIRRRLGEAGTTAFALSMLQDALSDVRTSSWRAGLFGLAICIASYWAGPWLTRTVNGLFGFDGAPA